MNSAFFAGATLAAGAQAALPQAPAPGTPNVLWYDRPAAQWIEALPLGNGRLGAMVFGGTDSERLQINDSTVWSGGPQKDANREDAWKRLEEIRKMIGEGRYDEAEKLCNAVMTCRVNYDLNKFQTLGDVTFAFQLPPGPVEDYRRWLDLDRAVSGVRFKAGGVTFLRETFASAADKVLVQRISSDRPGSVSFEVGLARPEKSETRFVAPDMLVMTGETGPNLQFQVNLRVLSKGGVISGDGNKIRVEGANEATVLLAANTSYVMDYAKGYKGDDPARAEAQVNMAAAMDFGRLLQAHLAEYQPLFRSVAIDLGATDAAKAPTDERVRAYGDGRTDPALAALLFQYGRYLLISSSRADSPVPANLQGLWAEQLNTPWNGDYTININFEMNYWPAEQTGLSQMHLPMLRHIQSLTEPGSKTAKAYFGPETPGWVTSAKSNVWGWTSPGARLPWGVWFGSNGWLCQHLWDHYAFGRDKEYLRSVYPTMKGACDFWLDQLVAGKDGKLITSPSSSPENSFVTDSGMKGSVDEGATMERAIIWDLFDNTIKASEVLGEDPAYRKELMQARDRIRPLQIGKAGQLMEWGEDWDLNAPDMAHRHVSHLYPLHPGHQISAIGTPELADAARKTLDLRGDDGTGWAIAWKINFWARLRDGDHAHRILSRQLRPTSELKVVMKNGGTYPNLFDAHPPFQIDGNFGATSGMAEMLLQSQEPYVDPKSPNADRYVMDLLPALPSAWPSGVITGLRARGGFTVDLFWKDGKLTKAVIRNDKGGSGKVRLGERTRDISLKPGESITLTGDLTVAS